MRNIWLELLLLLVGALCIHAASLRDFTDYLEKRYGKEKSIKNDKRGREYNKCEGKGEPFPCKTVQQCIPLKYVCDNNKDCDDGYDEDKEMCRAFQRPAAAALEDFLHQEDSWIMKSLFADKPIDEVAEALVVSRSIDDFRRRTGMKLSETDNLIDALRAIEGGDKQTLIDMGMKSSSWGDIQDLFGKLIDTGISPDYY